MATAAGGEAPNGPRGFTWRARRGEALHVPPRPTLRWVLIDGFAPPYEPEP
jgi:hypothetical protein